MSPCDIRERCPRIAQAQSAHTVTRNNGAANAARVITATSRTNEPRTMGGNLLEGRIECLGGNPLRIANRVGAKGLSDWLNAARRSIGQKKSAIFRLSTQQPRSTTNAKLARQCISVPVHMLQVEYGSTAAHSSDWEPISFSASVWDRERLSARARWCLRTCQLMRQWLVSPRG